MGLAWDDRVHDHLVWWIHLRPPLIKLITHYWFMNWHNTKFVTHHWIGIQKKKMMSPKTFQCEGCRSMGQGNALDILHSHMFLWNFSIPISTMTVIIPGRTRWVHRPISYQIGTWDNSTPIYSSTLKSKPLDSDPSYSKLNLGWATSIPTYVRTLAFL